MNKRIFYLLIASASLITFSLMLSSFFKSSKSGEQDAKGSIYDFKMTALDGEVVDFSKYKGKKLLIVNTASKCGYTPQYADLQKLHELHSDKVTILGFPANNFLWQEPGTNEQIAQFCRQNYGVTFQMFEKISVKGGDKHPLYRWLEAKTGETPSWNFCKYVVDETGEVQGFFPAKVGPLDEPITRLILQ